MTDDYLEYLAGRLRRVQDIKIGEEVQSDSLALHAEVGGRSVRMEVKRDFDPASPADAEFVAHALSDMRRLIEALRSKKTLSASALLAIEWRSVGASGGPWHAHLEQDKVGGCDIIAVNDPHDPRDLYLYFDGELAPSRLFLEVARARQDLPALVQWARSRNDERDS